MFLDDIDGSRSYREHPPNGDGVKEKRLIVSEPVRIIPHIAITPQRGAAKVRLCKPHAHDSDNAVNLSEPPKVEGNLGPGGPSVPIGDAKNQESGEREKYVDRDRTHRLAVPCYRRCVFITAISLQKVRYARK